MEKVNHKVFYSDVLIYLTVLFCNNIEIESARVLACFPVASISHQIVFRPITQELAKRGHEVVVITTDPAFPKGETPPNLIEIDVHELSYHLWQKELLKFYHKDIKTMMKYGYTVTNEIFMEQIKSYEIQNMLNNKNITFDIVLTAASVETVIVLGYIYEVPVIQISTFGENYNNHDIIGSPTDALRYLQIFRKRIYNLNILEEADEYYNYLMIMKNFEHVEVASKQMLKKTFGYTVPSIREMKNNVAMLFLNIHPLWDIRPVPSGVVHMGGIHLKDQKELPKELKTYLDSSLNGVVYVSFGSNIQISTLPPEMVNILIKVFSQLPYDVLLKCDLDTLEGIPANVKLSKWLPQADLLRHHNVKAFVTQGGLQSTEEAISSAVPMIAIPFNSDQYLNAEHHVHFGIGIKLERDKITEEILREAIVTIVTNESYHLNILKLRSWMRDQPQSSLSRAVWWTEHVLQHGGARHLRAPAANMSWAEKMEVDLLIIVLSVTLLLTCVFLFISYILLQQLRKIIYMGIVKKLYLLLNKRDIT